MTNTVIPLPVFDRNIVLTKLEPQIIELLDEKIVENSIKMLEQDREKHSLLNWNRSAYLRRLIIDHLNISLEAF